MPVKISEKNFGTKSCYFDGKDDFLSMPNDKDFCLGENSFEAYNLGDRLVFRIETINREFYSLTSVDFSDYYVIN